MTAPHSSTIALIAGNGNLPLEAASALLAKGERVYVVGIAGEADESISAFDHDVLQWGQVGRMFRLLRENCVDRVILAGGVVGRPDLDIRKMDWGAIRTLPEVLSVILSGDNTILEGVIGIFEKRGFKVSSIPELLPELMVTPGPNSAKMPRKADMERMLHAADVTQALGKFDIGQGAIVVGNRVVAVEGVEGTDAMLERVAHLREIGRLPTKGGGVLVKCVKPGQDERADLPTIGPNTIHGVHIAGLNGIGVEAHRTIIVERDKTLALARALGVFVHGLEFRSGTS